VDRDTYLARWSAAHGGFDPQTSPWVLGWLQVVYVAASPLARRRVPADLVTGAGLLVGAAVPAVAAAGGRWPVLAALLAVLCGLLDGLDGAVAALLDTASPWGHVLDSFVDRCTDLLLLSALWVLGAPPELCVVAGALTLLQEGARASGTAAGLREVGVLTVWERPSRIILATLSLLGAGTWTASADSLAAAGAAVAAALAGIGVVQLLASMRRRLS
jgi:CDP-diacylglycerol--glycerol-3-phosphate 3-phosphatidyltransferase